jgi:hypothetical protein
MGGGAQARGNDPLNREVRIRRGKKAADLRQQLSVALTSENSNFQKLMQRLGLAYFP